MFRAAALLASLALLAAVVVAGPATADRPAPDAAAAARRAPSNTTLRFDGIGAIRLGMTRNAAYKTGLIRSHADTCLDGKKPLPVSYGSDGPKAAPGSRFTSYFRGGRNGRLMHIFVTAGVRTELGIRPGVSTASEMMRVYRRAGYTVRARTRPDFAGVTFVDVLRRGRVVMTAVTNGTARAKTPLLGIAIPSYFDCRY